MQKPAVGEWVRIFHGDGQPWYAKIVQVDKPPAPGEKSTRPMFGVRHFGRTEIVRAFPWGMTRLSLLEAIALEAEEAELYHDGPQTG